ncbi:MAG: hypothetical protein JW885_03715 [Deltaproteobacteria bacterium]|nr:hypothetical protein [Candidatus Zymogenaceae bacterium]
MATKKKRFGELLVEKKVITEDDLSQALSYITKNGGRVGDALVALDIISEDQLMGALRYHFGIPVVDLKRIRIRQDIINLVPKETALKHRVVPFRIKEKTLFVVMSNPMDLNAVEDIEFASGYRIQPILSKESEIANALSTYYLGIAPKKTEDHAAKEGTEDDVLDEVDIVPGEPTDEHPDAAAVETVDENPTSNDTPDYPAPPTPSREEAIASEEAHLHVDAEPQDEETPESFFLRDIVQYPHVELDDEPVLSLEEVEVEYETAVEERRVLGDLIEELEEVDAIMHTAIMKNRRILKNLIILLVKKGYLTTEEIQNLAAGEIREESTH